MKHETDASHRKRRSKTRLEIYRVLKPGGIFIGTHYINRSLETYSHTKFGYKMNSEGKVVSAAQDAGFNVETAPIMGGRAYSLVCRKQ